MVYYLCSYNKTSPGSENLLNSTRSPLTVRPMGLPLPRCSPMWDPIPNVLWCLGVLYPEIQTRTIYTFTISTCHHGTNRQQLRRKRCTTTTTPTNGRTATSKLRRTRSTPVIHCPLPKQTSRRTSSVCEYPHHQRGYCNGQY